MTLPSLTVPHTESAPASRSTMSSVEPNTSNSVGTLAIRFCHAAETRQPRKQADPPRCGLVKLEQRGRPADQLRGGTERFTCPTQQAMKAAPAGGSR